MMTKCELGYLLLLTIYSVIPYIIWANYSEKSKRDIFQNSISHKYYKGMSIREFLEAEKLQTHNMLVLEKRTLKNTGIYLSILSFILFLEFYIFS